MKITNEIYQVGGGALTSPEDAAIYLINFNDQAAIVDAGCGGAENKLLKNIAACGIQLEQIQYLLITHCHFDHTGGAKSLSDKCECQIVAHALDAVFLEEGNNTVTATNWYGSSIVPFIVDRKLKGSLESIDLGQRTIQAIHTPGHSPGSVVYLTESEGLKVLFAQDVHGPLDRSFRSVKKDYLKSLELLLSLEADILCEGHFGIYRGQKKVKNFIKQFLK